MEGSCAKDFGRELGQIHEGIITLRGLGLTADGWQNMTIDKDLAQKVVELIEGKKEMWLEKIIARERACHRAFFGQEFDLTNFTANLKRYGGSKIRFWQKLGLEPGFFPVIALSQDAELKGWTIKPNSWFYQHIAAGKIFRDINGQLITVNAANLEGITVLIDTRLKPQYNNGKQMYEKDNLLGPVIEQLRKAGKIQKYEYGPQSSRFGVSANEWESQVKPVLAQKLCLNANQVRLECATEANVISKMYSYMPRKNDGDTNTWVWYEEFFEVRVNRLLGGYSGYGGLAHVHWDSSGGHWHSGSFRPLAVL